MLYSHPQSLLLYADFFPKMSALGKDTKELFAHSYVQNVTQQVSDRVDKYAVYWIIHRLKNLHNYLKTAPKIHH